MKFSCEKSIFLDAINTASRAVSGKSAIALLEGLLINANDQLTLTGYDLSIGVSTTVGAEITEPGSIVLNAKLLGDIVRKLADDVVHVETDEKLLTSIRCGRAVFNLVASPAEEYPQMPEVSEESSLSLPGNVLKTMISRTIFAVSDNESKPIHTGCLFETENDAIHVVAVDGYRMAVRREKLETPCQNPLRFVVPGMALREIERIVGDREEAVAIYPDKKHILFRMGHTMVISRLIEGEFLNYRAAIPNDADHAIQADARSLITSIERVSLITSEKLKNPVRLHFDGDVLKLSCITAIGKSYDEFPLSTPIEDLEIGFNNRYLLDALRACADEDAVTISLKGALNPLLIHPTEGDRFMYLVLPVRLKAGD